MKSKYYVVDICCLLLFQQVSADLNYRFSKCAFSEGAFHERCIASPSLGNCDVNRMFSLSKCSEKTDWSLKLNCLFTVVMCNRFVEYDIIYENAFSTVLNWAKAPYCNTCLKKAEPSVYRLTIYKITYPMLQSKTNEF